LTFSYEIIDAVKFETIWEIISTDNFPNVGTDEFVTSSSLIHHVAWDERVNMILLNNKQTDLLHVYF